MGWPLLTIIGITRLLLTFMYLVFLLSLILSRRLGPRFRPPRLQSSSARLQQGLATTGPCCQNNSTETTTVSSQCRKISSFSGDIPFPYAPASSTLGSVPRPASPGTSNAGGARRPRARRARAKDTVRAPRANGGPTARGDARVTPQGHHRRRRPAATATHTFSAPA